MSLSPTWIKRLKEAHRIFAENEESVQHCHNSTALYSSRIPVALHQKADHEEGTVQKVKFQTVPALFYIPLLSGNPFSAKTFSVFSNFDVTVI